MKYKLLIDNCTPLILIIFLRVFEENRTKYIRNLTVMQLEVAYASNMEG